MNLRNECTLVSDTYIIILHNSVIPSFICCLTELALRPGPRKLELGFSDGGGKLLVVGVLVYLWYGR